ncbi:ABC transporter ATP-binding protein [Cesiribacter andamanensis]|uniref:Lipoprotein-releasing system ATP-binding protein LolD n=1 Tax=Cesiribacter andamanensis AMV16 TaxID=1279009 RepID=M7MZX1_9BACT|nr:ABC transporter ATP-binding protein [Cesiribacter andamanensis]EMR01983.1 Lipoprotein-releasing system ATP-binding protein LolD [Cesiribacter andamanensis AMV16]
MAIIQLSNISKTYQETKVPVHALNGISLEIEKEEFTAIVGPSGCGKTTLLNLIGGLDHPSSGRVVLDGTDITRLKDSRLIDFRLHKIGFVFQAYNLIPVLTALENVSFIMQLQGRPEKEIRERARRLLEHVGLGDRMHNRPNELSGGQQQRVAVARALASRPVFVLADEPTANLDSSATARLLDMMAQLNREEGMTFLFSTHDHRVIERARRVITLEDGKVVSDTKSLQYEAR